MSSIVGNFNNKVAQINQLSDNVDIVMKSRSLIQSFKVIYVMDRDKITKEEYDTVYKTAKTVLSTTLDLIQKHKSEIDPKYWNDHDKEFYLRIKTGSPENEAYIWRNFETDFPTLEEFASAFAT